MDKSFWLQIKKNAYQLPDESDLKTLTLELRSYLGSPDMELRNDIAYAILEHWIVEQNLYTNAELEAMCGELLVHLREGIGETDTDSIFLRSFSVWVLAFILQRDSNIPFLSHAKFNAIIDHIEAYMRDERDLRGWVVGKGWAHATAHIASIMGVMARHPYADTATLERLLALIADHMTRHTDTIYGYSEDDRMAQTIYYILSANRVDMAILSRWLRKLEAVMELASEGMAFDIRVFNAYMNTRNFLRSLYFPIELCVPQKPAVWEEFLPDLLAAIKEVGLC